MSRPGRLVGVGMGPGDPGLVTLAALRALESADHVAVPTAAPDIEGRAERIVRAVTPDLQPERVCFPMTRAGLDAEVERAEAFAAAARSLIPRLADGRTVAFATLGDPSLYSTFPSLAARVTEALPGVGVEVVPGISALQALAAKTATVLADGTERLVLATALDGPGDALSAAADPRTSVVVYKTGRHLRSLCDGLASLGRLDDAVAGELLGTPNEHVGPLAHWAAPEGASYFTTVIVPARRRDPR
jgi:precorrin-2/cobalt-factor-2 C20-methyltransferase